MSDLYSFDSGEIEINIPISLYFLFCLCQYCYTYYLIYTKSPTMLIIIHCIILYLLKQLKEKSRTMTWFTHFVVVILLAFLVPFLYSCEYKLPSNVNSFCQYSFASTHLLCVVIVEYIIVKYVTGPAIKLHAHGFIQLHFK